VRRGGATVSAQGNLFKLQILKNLRFSTEKTRKTPKRVEEF
jgi:hypothetical protein